MIYLNKFTFIYLLIFFYLAKYWMDFFFFFGQYVMTFLWKSLYKLHFTFTKNTVSFDILSFRIEMWIFMNIWCFCFEHPECNIFVEEIGIEPNYFQNQRIKRIHIAISLVWIGSEVNVPMVVWNDSLIIK